jgi:hypothetical protein
MSSHVLAIDAPRNGEALGVVGPILRLEGLAALTAGLLIYGQLGGDWLWSVPLLLLPDLSMIGYLSGPVIGALLYDVVHNWALGLAVLGLGLWLGSTPVLLGGAILVAHVGLDRLAGYGLKYPTGFRDTHLQRA